MTSPAEPAPLGLRERKKVKTRAAIQQHALRLFRKQGYVATTIEQIAEAAEVSPSTFFRYFPTKEDVVLLDVYDAPIIEAIRAQPAELRPTRALRGAMRAVFGQLSAEQSALERDRQALILDTPELRARMLQEFTRTIQSFNAVLAERLGKPVHDFTVLVTAGALMGVAIAAILAAADDPGADYLKLIDAGLARLEEGIPL